MTRLIRDRYYAYATEHAWDLATGETVNVGDLDDDGLPAGALAQADLSAAGLAKADLSALNEVLDHGREGEPRWLTLDASRTSPPTAAARAAANACARGFVPVAADVYFCLRDVLTEELEHRALLLIVRPNLPLEIGRAALVDAATRSSRPHVLMSFSGVEPRPARIDRVREARAHYGVDVVRRMLPASMTEEVRRQIARAARADEFVRRGRHAAAERLLRDVIGALLRRRALVPAVHASISLGRLVLERGRAVDAERLFDEAAGHAHAAHDEALSLSARIWQAAARTDAGQLTAAESLCRAAVVTGRLSTTERARADATLARILLWQGRVDEAAALDVSMVDEQDDAAPFVEATAVRVLLARGMVFQAGHRARALLTIAGRSKAPLAQVLALSAHLRVLMAAGDATVVMERMNDLARAAQQARAPLRLARVRLLAARMLRAVRDTTAADAVLAHVRRMRAVSPPLLKQAIDDGFGTTTASQTRHAIGLPAHAAVAMVTIVQDRESDRDAVKGILDFAGDSVQTSRLDLCSNDAGPVTTVLSVGSGLRTGLGQRVLEAGITIDSQDRTGGEFGVPVRLGTRLVAALVARWPADRARPGHAHDLLALAAAIAAPRIDAMRAAARQAASTSATIPELVGVSREIDDVRRAVARAASAPFAVLIEGESGVGKELVARAIHQLSARRERRFCDLNCAALPDDLLESELFGHARGAYTGAVTDRAGLIEEADGGTLFLDEVADLSPRAQAKLLRVLQQQEVRRVGETFSRKVDVRVVSAANRDVQAEAAASRFRADLLYRLDVIRIRVPALRERPEDIAVLAHHFWAAVAPRVETRATLTHGLMTALAHYHWPGNVRELQNVMAALAVAAPARGQVRASLLPRAITGVAVSSSMRLVDARQQFERRFIEAALARAGGRRTRAARELGLSRQGLLKMIVRLGIGERCEDTTVG
ncbi:MAG TPA: sigma-54 dependent transcriptional regulator [Vicinamibacterales bacterium]